MAAFARRPLVPVAAAVVVGCLVVGCSGAAREGLSDVAVAASGETAPFVDVRNTSLDVTVENQAGMPLMDVLVAIKPIGRPAYTKRIARMEGGQKRSMVLSEFTGNDGTQFSLNIGRPREITVTAVDLVGKERTMTTPWRR